MIPVYPLLNVTFFKFFSFIKHFLREFGFNDTAYLAKLRQRKVTTRSGENFTQFCFCFILELNFYVQK